MPDLNLRPVEQRRTWTAALGILGGMGPLASAEFLKTIYETNISGPEQDSPACILYSDPRVPDRTEAILLGSEDDLLSGLALAIENLCQLNVRKVVIACVTSHHLLTSLPAHLSEKIISLVNLILAEVLVQRKKYLLLCSTGTRRARVFEHDRRWSEAAEFIVLPSDKDQALIHDLIYRLKRNASTKDSFECLAEILEKYKLNSFIAGCTEFHLLTRYLKQQETAISKYEVIDPLLMLAQNFRSLTSC